MNIYKDKYIKYKKKYLNLKYGGSSQGSSQGFSRDPSGGPPGSILLDGKKSSFDELMKLDKKYSVDQDNFINLISMSSSKVNLLLNRLLINLVVEHYNYIERKKKEEKKTNWYNYRTFIDFKQASSKNVGSYQINFEKLDGEIAKIINVLKNITITNNGSEINGFQFFVFLSKLIAIDYGGKKRNDKHSTGEDLKEFSNPKYSEIQMNKLMLLKVKKEWNLFPIISGKTDALWLITTENNTTENKSFKTHKFLESFYENYYNYTKSFNSKELDYVNMNDPAPPPPKSTYKFSDEF